MSDLGKGIAVAGVWISIAIMSFSIGEAVVPLVVFACLATLFVCI